MIAEQTYTIEDYEFEDPDDDSSDNEFYEEEIDSSFEDEFPASRWTIRKVLIMLLLLIIAAAIVVFFILPLIEAWTNPATPLHLPTPIQA